MAAKCARRGDQDVFERDEGPLGDAECGCLRLADGLRGDERTRRRLADGLRREERARRRRADGLRREERARRDVGRRAPGRPVPPPRRLVRRPSSRAGPPRRKGCPARPEGHARACGGHPSSSATLPPGDRARRVALVACERDEHPQEDPRERSRRAPEARRWPHATRVDRSGGRARSRDVEAERRRSDSSGAHRRGRGRVLGRGELAQHAARYCPLHLPDLSDPFCRPSSPPVAEACCALHPSIRGTSLPGAKFVGYECCHPERSEGPHCRHGRRFAPPGQT